ncbi:hypothetical protein PHYBOEH_007043 [Phytophthora boehmeriae]|uniref:Uncharacterized protein n=1 Tax=Phytophthora boehmeriae TaxID=109152 RepID=A0A8T1WAN6_9STRA|nr:hypothetical protein PHYBOEH_007043 [Phytophthora boehmeriae]
MLDCLLEGECGCQKALKTLRLLSDNMDSDIKAFVAMSQVQDRVPEEVMLKFVKCLEPVALAIGACDAMLHVSSHWNTLAVARTLYEKMSEVEGKDLLLAEICWMQHLSAEVRAIVTSSPVKIVSTLGNNLMYAAGSNFTRLRGIRRNDTVYYEQYRQVFCWKKQWKPDRDKELWQFVPHSSKLMNVYVVNMSTGEYLYVTNFFRKVFRADFSVKDAFTLRTNELPDALGQWRVVQREGSTIALCNQQTKNFLMSPPTPVIGPRRAVQTSSYRPCDHTWSQARSWKIIPTTTPKIEKALDAFFSQNYDKAIELLAELQESGELSREARAKLLCYEVVASLVLKREVALNACLVEFLALGGDYHSFLPVLAGKVLGEKTAADLIEMLTRKLQARVIKSD